MKPTQFDLNALSERFAATRIGQYAITKAEKALWIIEKTAAWGIPRKSSKEVPVQRPLPWIPFFMLIVVLRMSRATLTFVSILLNKPVITPEKSVLFIQERRRALRAIKYNGLQELNSKEPGIIPIWFNKLINLLTYLVPAIGSINSIPTNSYEASNSTNAISIKIKRSINPRSEVSCDQSVDKFPSKGSDADDSEYILDTEQTSTGSDDEDSETEDLRQIASKITQELIDQVKKSKLELEEKSPEESVTDIKEDNVSKDVSNNEIITNDEEKSEIIENETITDSAKLNSLNPEYHTEMNHISSPEITNTEILQSPPIANGHETKINIGSPSIPVDPELLVQKLSEQITKLTNLQNDQNYENPDEDLKNGNAVNQSINAEKLAPNIAHNGNVDEITKHINQILQMKDVYKQCANEKGYVNAFLPSTNYSYRSSSTEDIYYSALGSPDVETTYENHQTFDKIDDPECQADSHVEKDIHKVEENQPQVQSKQNKNHRSPYQNQKRYKGGRRSK